MLSHGGVDEKLIDETELYMKEYLNCVRELDLQVRPNQVNKPSEGDLEKVGPAWCRSNLLSTFGLLEIMKAYGPVVNLWDGGGKGEKFFPTVKKHLPRGIRAKETSYFANLQKRIYKVQALNAVVEELLGSKRGRESMYEH